MVDSVNRTLVEQLARVNPIHLSCNEKLAFWINLYNALIMHVSSFFPLYLSRTILNEMKAYESYGRLCEQRLIWLMASQKATWSFSRWCKRLYHLTEVLFLSSHFFVALFDSFVLAPQAAYTVGGHSYTAATMEYVILKMKPPMHRPQIVWALNPASSVGLFCSPPSESVKQFTLLFDVGSASRHPQDESVRRTAQGKHWYTWPSSWLCFKLWNVLIPCGN